MKINMFKLPGGQFAPASDLDFDKTTKFKTGCQYEIDIKQTRNPQFHGKVFTFLQFCFEYWKGDNEYHDEAKQFEVFRNHLTVLAGFYDTFHNINGEVRIEAKSLSYGNMEQEEFEQFYNAVIQVAMRKIFVTNDQNVLNKLMSFF